MVVKSRTRRRAGRVTRGEVIAAAVELVDRDGVDALTIRAVADACGLSPMGVYRHVRDKEDLLDRIVDSVVNPSLESMRATGTWDEQIVELFGTARRLFLEHPGVAVLCVLRPTPVVGVARFYDRVLAALSAGGLEGKDAVQAFDSLLMFMFGSVLWEIPRTSNVRQRLVTVALDDDSTTHVINRATELSRRDASVYFDAGLQLLLEGIRTQVRSS